MGANFQCFTMPATAKTVAEVEQLAKAAVAQAKVENGTDRYSGTISTADGVKVEGYRPPFANDDDAEAYLLENAEKWGPLVVVPFLDAGKVRWLAGMWCAE